MKVELQRITESADGALSDAVIIIECQCRNKVMKDEAGDFTRKEIYVYLRGITIKNLRCSKEGSMCRERYRTMLHMEACLPFVEVAHIAPRPSEIVLETIKIEIPLEVTPKIAKKSEMYPCEGYPNPNPYDR